MSATYTLILGTKNWSSWSLRPYMAMRAAGVPFEETVIPLRQPDSAAKIQAIAPTGKVPALRIAEKDESYVVFDSLAICETLADRHPEAGLWPGDPRARAEARSISAAMHSGFPELRSALSMEFARRLPTPPMTDTLRAEIDQIVGFWQEALNRFGGVNAFLFGRLSIADCMYAPVVSRFRTYGIALPDDVAAYCDRILALPALRDWEAASRLEVEAGLPCLFHS
ncbi:MAG TPA: glutathione S-transferase family protein [Rhizomicrobium sp.]|jgi:glutathione S-transferase